MKKLTAILLAALMLVSMFAFASCGGNNAAPADDTAADVADDAADVADDAADDADDDAAVENTDAADDTADDAADADSDLAYVLDKGTLIVGITDYAPMNYYVDGELTGFDTEFALLVAEKLGIAEVEFVEINWATKAAELETKNIDCVWNGMTITDEVEEAMDCSVPYVINAQVLVMKSDKLADYTTVDSLATLSFVAERGSAGAQVLVDAGFTPVEVDTQAKALMEVKNGTADACVIDITMANAMTGEGTDYADLGYAFALTEEVYGIGFRTGSDMVDAVNAAIAELKADGTLAALADKYALTLAD